MTGVSIIHARQVPSSRRKSIPTAIRRVVERGRDRRLVRRIVEEVHRTPAIQTFPPVPIAQSRTVDHEKETREVLASLQLMHTVIIPFLTVTHMAMSATASPTMSIAMRLLFGLSTPVLQERFTITTVKQKSPNGKSQKNGLSEKEERKTERTEKKRDFMAARDGRENREHLASSKPSKYISPSKNIHRDHHSSSDKRDGNHTESRNMSAEQKKEIQQRLSGTTDRGSPVVKTSCVHTTALPTVVYRPSPTVASMGGESAVSPSGSLQDVSPPTTPSSRSNMYEPSSHTPSPNIVTAVSPQVAQQHGVPSPQFSSRHSAISLAPNVFPQAPAVTGAPRVVPQQYQYPVGHPHIQNDYRQQYVNSNSNPPQLQITKAALSLQATHVPSPQQPVMFNQQISPQTALHPLQQATLVLQQRKMSEAQAAAAGVGNIQPSYPVAASTVTPAAPLPQLAVSPVSVAIHRKEDRSHVHSSPGSPVVFTQHPPVAVVNESSSSHSHHSSHQQLASSSSIVSSSPLSHSSNASSPVPVVQPAAPTVNLQTVAKYVDKNLISHLSAWPTEAMDRQLQKLWEETGSFSNDSDKAKIEQMQLQSEVGFMEMRLDTASRRISSLKGMTRTLEALLAESEAKFLS